MTANLLPAAIGYLLFAVFVGFLTLKIPPRRAAADPLLRPGLVECASESLWGRSAGDSSRR